MSAIALEILDLLMQRMDPMEVSTTILQLLDGAAIEDLVIGVCFQTLGRLSELRYSTPAKNGNCVSLEREILQPLFERRLLSRHIQSNPVVGNRKAIFDFLVSLWRVLGDVGMDRYFSPSSSSSSVSSSGGSHVQFRNALPAPCLTLLKVLIAQEKSTVR